MVPKKSRLPREGFRVRGYRTFTAPFFSLKVRKNQLEDNRIAVVVGKSVDKRAVRRNAVERQAKLLLLGVPACGVDAILTVFSKANDLSKSDFTVELEKLLKNMTS
jgi:ribonuclease P protein component